jgi:hypothetical protein
MPITRSVAGYAHTHIAARFYFTPLKVDDRFTPNFHLSDHDILTAPRVTSLNQIEDVAAREAIQLGETFDNQAEGWVGLMWTPAAAENPIMLRSPAARYSLLLKQWFKALPDKPESGRPLYRIQAIGDLTLVVRDETGAGEIEGINVPIVHIPTGEWFEGKTVKAQDELMTVYFKDLKPGAYRVSAETPLSVGSTVIEVKAEMVNEAVLLLLQREVKEGE